MVVKVKRFGMRRCSRRTRSPRWRSSDTPSSCSSTRRPRGGGPLPAHGRRLRRHPAGDRRGTGGHAEPIRGAQKIAGGPAGPRPDDQGHEEHEEPEGQQVELCARVSGGDGSRTSSSMAGTVARPQPRRRLTWPDEAPPSGCTSAWGTACSVPPDARVRSARGRSRSSGTTRPPGVAGRSRRWRRRNSSTTARGRASARSRSTRLISSTSPAPRSRSRRGRATD